MDIVGSLVGIDSFEVHHVTHDGEAIGNAVAAMHVTRHARDVERFATVVSLEQADHFRRRTAHIHQPSHTQNGLQAKGNLGLHIGQFLLEELRLRQGAVELFPIEAVLTRRMPAGLRRAHHAPANAIAGPIQTSKRPFKALNAG